MALTKDDLYVGKLIYRLQIENNMHSRRKVTMIDADGNEWHRYDQELWTFKVTPMNICGIIKQVVRGVVVSDNISEDEYHLRTVNSTEDDIDFFVESQLTDVDPRQWTQFFPWIEDANAAGKLICNERNT